MISINFFTVCLLAWILSIHHYCHASPLLNRAASPSSSLSSSSSSNSAPISTEIVFDDDLNTEQQPVDNGAIRQYLLHRSLQQLYNNEPVDEYGSVDSSLIEQLNSGSRSSRLARGIRDNNGIPTRFRSRTMYIIPNSRSSKRAATMGIDLPDYILHINKGRNFDYSAFRQKMEKSG